ncbi:MAG: co-chaperone GroES, partial [Chlamydiota bacterium]
VLFSSYAPREIESNEELLLLSEDDILGILEEVN